ncbi:MAG: peroxiredoxin, partial [Blastocatellia bacterium]
MLPKIGYKAPDFTLQDDKGKKVKLGDYKGRKVVLYFYPRDMTPGCTKEACGFRDDLSRLKEQNVEVLGVSTDGTETHGKFREKYELNFPLLADTDHKVADKYGVW